MRLTLIALLTLSATLAQAAEHTVAQKGKAFSVASLNIKVGDKVAFRNDDPFAHNVFTLSDPMQFDLGTYPQGQAKSVTFAKAGQYEVECAIHPEMKMIIHVKP
jgi:plastocyanin